MVETLKKLAPLIIIIGWLISTVSIGLSVPSDEVPEPATIWGIIFGFIVLFAGMLILTKKKKA